MLAACRSKAAARMATFHICDRSYQGLTTSLQCRCSALSTLVTSVTSPIHCHQLQLQLHKQQVTTFACRQDCLPSLQPMGCQPSRLHDTLDSNLPPGGTACMHACMHYLAVPMHAATGCLCVMMRKPQSGSAAHKLTPCTLCAVKVPPTSGTHCQWDNNAYHTALHNTAARLMTPSAHSLPGRLHTGCIHPSTTQHKPSPVTAGLQRR